MYARDDTWPQDLFSDFLIVLGHSEDCLDIIRRYCRVIRLGIVRRGELHSFGTADFPNLPL